MTDSRELPPSVRAAYRRAWAAGFELSCEPEVGRLLSALAAAVPREGRILEIGTGAGAGLAWIVEGLADRDDVEVVTVELDADVQAVARASGWPSYVRFELGEGAEMVRTLGTFNLIFPDAPGGKIFKLRRTLDTLRPGGALIVDDMDLTAHEDPALRAGLGVVRDRLISNPELACAEMSFASGVILAVRRHA